MKHLFIALLLTSCMQSTNQKLNPETYYRHDLCFRYKTNNYIRKKIKNFFRRFKNGRYRRTEKVREEIEFCGVGVLPYMESYDIEVSAFGDLNFFSLTTCHEETTSENPDSGIFKDDGEVNIHYAPTIERGKACPLYIAAYNKKQKHAWGIILLEDNRYKLEAKLNCNGYEQVYNGVSVCQSRQGLVQKISFSEPVKLVKPVQGAAEKTEECPQIGESGKKEYEFLIPPRECFYGFIGQESEKIHKLLTVGYENIIVRE